MRRRSRARRWCSSPAAFPRIATWCPANAIPENGWWQRAGEAGRRWMPTRTRMLAIDWVGADGTLDVPIDTADQADAIAAVLDALGIERVAAFVGCSYGALVGLQFAARHRARIGTPGRDQRHAPRASVRRAWRALQRRPSRSAQLQCADAQGLSLARQLAMLSYRTPEEFDERFDAAPVIVARPRARARPRTISMPAARSTWRARRSRRSCACPNRSTCTRSTRQSVRVPTDGGGGAGGPAGAADGCLSRWSSACRHGPAAACCARRTATTPSSRKPTRSPTSSRSRCALPTATSSGDAA